LLIDARKGPPTFCIDPFERGPRSIATNPALSMRPITISFASGMASGGQNDGSVLLGRKILVPRNRHVADRFHNSGHGVISATISLDVLPFEAEVRFRVLMDIRSID
jgi:hypothetical protein